jgi:hypothetical protein
MPTTEDHPMPTDPLLLTHPATAEMAERLAAEWVFACPQSIHAGCNPDPIIYAFARLLSDLSRPESRDAWVRWLVAWDTEHAKEMVSVSVDDGGYTAYFLPTGRLMGVGDTEREAVSVARALIATGHHRNHLRNNPTALLAAIQGVSRG